MRGILGLFCLEIATKGEFERDREFRDLEYGLPRLGGLVLHSTNKDFVRRWVKSPGPTMKVSCEQCLSSFSTHHSDIHALSIGNRQNLHTKM